MSTRKDAYNVPVTDAFEPAHVNPAQEDAAAERSEETGEIQPPELDDIDQSNILNERTRGKKIDTLGAEREVDAAVNAADAADQGS